MNQLRSKPRAGFTLVALLVLLALFGLFVAMFFPAVLKARAAAKRTGCANNLKQLALAAHDYHSAFEKLPPGWLGPNFDAPAKGFETPASYAGCLVVLMPYYEQDNLYKQLFVNWDIRARTDTGNIDPRTGIAYFPNTTVPWWKASLIPNTQNLKEPTNFTVAQTRIRMLVCPDDDPYTATEATIGALSLFGPAAPKDFLEAKRFEYKDKDMMDARVLGRTNYLGVAGMAGRGSKTQVEKAPPGLTYGLYEGVFYNRSDTTLGQLAVQDGSSNTLMFGEALGGMEMKEGEMPQRLSSFSYLCGALPTYHGLPPAGQGPWHSFSSRHTRAVNFARGDGSVISVRRGQTTMLHSNDWWVLQEMAGKRDGGLRATNMLVD